MRRRPLAANALRDVLAPGPADHRAGRRPLGWRHLGVAHCGALDPMLRVGQPAGRQRRRCGRAGNHAARPDAAVRRARAIALCGAARARRASNRRERASRSMAAAQSNCPPAPCALGALRDGARAWLAFAGGIDVPLVLGSRSTDLRGGFGGFEGRALRAGDDAAPWRTRPPLDCEHPRDARVVDRSRRDELRHADPLRALVRIRPRHAWQPRLAGQRAAAIARGCGCRALRFAGAAREQISAAGRAGHGAACRPTASRSCCSPTRRPWAATREWAMSSPPTCRAWRSCARERRLRFQPCDPQTATRLACAARARVARIALMIDHQIARGNTRMKGNHRRCTRADRGRHPVPAQQPRLHQPQPGPPDYDLVAGDPDRGGPGPAVQAQVTLLRRRRAHRLQLRPGRRLRRRRRDHAADQLGQHRLRRPCRRRGTMRATLRAVPRAWRRGRRASVVLPTAAFSAGANCRFAPAKSRDTDRMPARRLAAIAAAEGVRLRHVKPHGALYNVAARDRAVADAIAAAVARVRPALVLFGLSGSR